MRKLVLIGIGCLLFATAGAQQQENSGKAARQRRTASRQVPVQPARSAQLRLENPVYDFGDVPRKGGDVSHTFVYRNDGTAPLVVVRVITSCSCVKTSFSKRPVAPGAAGEIRITYEPHKSEPGAFNKVVQIYSNSASGRDILTVQGCSIEEQPRGKVKTDKLKVKYK